jgi:hypothetical protein
MTEAMARFMMVGLGFRIPAGFSASSLGGEPHGAMVGVLCARCGRRPDELCKGWP